VFKKIKQKGPILFLILLSPTIAELLSGSSPPLEFFNPISFLLLLGLYGGGVLIARELYVKWNKGWGSILLLGVAYGIIEEGLAVKSFFDPNWMDLGILGSYGRFIGVNWVWAICLTIFHTVFSIALPILIFTLVYPELKNIRLLQDKKLILLSFVFLVVVVILNIMAYKINLFVTIITTLIVILFIWTAHRVNPDFICAKDIKPSVTPKYIGFIGMTFIVIFFIIMYALPNLIQFPLIPIFLELLLCLIVLKFVMNNIGQTGNTRHKVALTWGLLLPLIIMAFIHEKNGVFGMSIVGIFFITFLFFIRRIAISKKHISIP
jgi:hypothetical protein